MRLNTFTLIKNSLPIAFAYLILGFTFGAIFSLKGGSTLESFVISLFCFAGAAQFVALEFYKPHFPVLLFFVTIFILNIRHIFYGLSFIGSWKGLKNIYLFGSLTDENFGISSLYRNHDLKDRDWIKIFALNQSYWVIGCTLGTLVPLKLISNIQGADFSLIALFVAIFASSIRKRRAKHANQ